MEKPSLTMAQQVAEAAAAFEKQRTGHAPQAVTVVLGDETLVITLHGALSPAERALAQTPEGAAQVQDFHRQLFNDSAETDCGRRSNESPVSRCAKPRPRSKRRPAPSCKCSRPAPWCRCSCSPAAYPRRPGTAMGLSTRPEHGGSCMLVLSRKRLESVVVGGYCRLRAPAQGHGTRTQGRQCATRLRGRFVRSCPSLGGVGKDPSAASQTVPGGPRPVV